MIAHELTHVVQQNSGVVQQKSEQSGNFGVSSSYKSENAFPNYTFSASNFPVELVQLKTLYRGMQADGNSPQVGRSARKLGIRPGQDVDTTEGPRGPCNGCNPETWVVANNKGMSVAPNDPKNLPRHRRPPTFDGTGKDPVWSIEPGLGLGLNAVQYIKYFEDKPGKHGVLAPRINMPLRIYENALASTRNQWEFAGGIAPEPVAQVGTNEQSNQDGQAS